jgi:hypothetical protein
MEFQIIEDCSPYYIRYTHTHLEKVIELSKEYKKNYIDNLTDKEKFMHIKMPEDSGTNVLSYVYKAEALKLNKKRVSLFVTQPRHYYRPHKDGLAVKVGINYNIDIRDKFCVTSWYSDESFLNRPIDNLGGTSREIGDYNRYWEKNVIKPVKSMTATVNEAVLFNTDLYHDVDNVFSYNERTILTLRSLLFENLDFLQARKILFDF